MANYVQTESGLYVKDGYQNLVAGLGGSRDKRSSGRFSFNPNNFDFIQLEAAYQDNWIARQIVNVPVDDGLREWREWQAENAGSIEQEEQRLRVAHHYKLARYWSRLYGGAVLLMLTDQDLSQPLDVNKIGQGGLKRLVVLDRWEIQPQRINYHNPLAEDYLLPEYYTIRSAQGQWIHSSHLIRVDGEELPRRLREWNETWGDSTLRKVLEDLKDVVGTKSGIASLILEANVDTISRQGLGAELASGQETEILQRYQLAGQMKSLVNMMLLDGDSETMERKQVTFSGLGEILDRLMVWISGAADIPMTRLFGRSAAGMNATGEGDLNNYYDSVRSMQHGQFTPDLNKLDQVLIRSALGQYPDDVDWQWRPLYQESGTELAQQELATAQSEDIRIQQGTLKRSHIMERIRQGGTYPITEEEIDAERKAEQAEESGTFDLKPGEEGLLTGDSFTFDESFEPPKDVQEAAQQGLDYRDKYERGGTDVGIARARDLSNGRNISAETIQEMTAFFARHEEHRNPDETESDGGPTNGWIAWLLWGGDPGRRWAETIAERLENENE